MLLMIALFFLTSSGIVLQHHYCNEEGLTTQFLFPVEHTCKQNVEPQSCSTSQCCKLSEEINLDDNYPALEKETCCSDETEFIHLDEDYTVSDNDSNVFLPKQLASCDDSKINLQQLNVFYKTGRAPPLIYSLPTRLAILQTYLI